LAYWSTLGVSRKSRAYGTKELHFLDLRESERIHSGGLQGMPIMRYKSGINGVGFPDDKTREAKQD